MTKNEAKKITKEQFRQWMDKNSDAGSLPCIPIILINSLTGDKPGITMNMTPHIALPDIAQFLKAAVCQVEAKIVELEKN